MHTVERSLVESPESAVLADPCPYLAHYGLRTVPFRMIADPRHLWLGRTHRAALWALSAAIHDSGGIVLLTGDVGTGKTSLANALADRLRDAGLLVGRVDNARFDLPEYRQAIASAYGLTGTFEDRDEFDTRVQELLGTAAAAGRKVVLIVDEAQSLSEDLFRETADLSDLAAISGGRLAIVLVAQGELNALLSDPRHEELSRRITTRCTLDPLAPHEVPEYIAHCLVTGGAQDDIFSAGATDEIAAVSGGVPRVINIICEHALMAGYERGARTITRDIVVNSGWRAQRGGRTAHAEVRLIGFDRSRRAAVSAHLGRVGAHVGRAILETFARSRAISIALGLAVVVLGGGYWLYAGWLGGIGHHSPRPAAHAPLAVQPDKPAPPAQVPRAPRVLEPTPSRSAASGASPNLAVAPASTERATPVIENIAPAHPAPPVRVKSTRARSAAPREHALAVKPKAAPPALTIERPDERPVAAASSKPQASKRDRDTPDPTEIVDWFLKEYSPARR